MKDSKGTRSPRKKKNRQLLVQLVSAVFFNGYVIGFQKGKIFSGSTKAICVPVLNCYSCPGALGACPIGSLQAVLNHRKFPFYVLGSLMLFGVVLGRLVCGFLCPFGLVQDLLNKIPHPRRKKFSGATPGHDQERSSPILTKVDHAARYVKYAVLLFLVILLPAFAPNTDGVFYPWFCKYVCPAGTLEGGIPLVLLRKELRSLAGALFDWKLFVLAAILIWSVFVPRPFCRYFCPLGAFYSLFNKFSLYQMKVDASRCISCHACESVCPMHVKVPNHIDSLECIRCGRCKAVCPTGAIHSGFHLTSRNVPAENDAIKEGTPAKEETPD